MAERYNLRPRNPEAMTQDTKEVSNSEDDDGKFFICYFSCRKKIVTGIN